MKVLALLALVANVIGYIFSLWLVGSLLTSGLKSFRGECGKQYGIEGYRIDGDFFCKK